MSKRKGRTISFDIEDETYCSKDDYDKDGKTFAIPNPDYSGCSNDSDSDTDCNEKLSSVTYEKASKSYRVDQAKLGKDHKFHWVNCERIYFYDIKNKVLLTESVRKNIWKSEALEEFGTFSFNEIKEYIIDACKENGFHFR